jgi:signal transduction histidine kinase
MDSQTSKHNEHFFSRDQPDVLMVRKRLEKLARQGRSLEDFSSQALQLIGEYTGAHSVYLSILDSERNCGVLHATLISRYSGWRFELHETDVFTPPASEQHARARTLPLRPIFIFRLDLSPKWLGTCHVEYPDDRSISSIHDQTISSILVDLSYGLLITFLNQQLKNQEKRLQRETRIKRNLRELSINQGKKIRALKRQVKLKCHDILEMEQRDGPALEYFVRPLSFSGETQSLFAKQTLEEIEHSRKMALLGELASGVAHQIRNPLNNILGALHLIKDSDTSEEERWELFNRLTERVETINRMISEFIHYTRILRLNRTPEEINTTLKNTLHSFKSWIDLANVELITSFDLQLPVINLDLNLMDQVFHNIIKNALEAVNNNGQICISTQKLKMKHGPTPRTEFVEISFQDSGPGIPKEEIKKVMNPFFSRKGDGLGLGLSIVDHVVRAHGGGIRIKSQPGRFTKVILYLPIR